jgi:hypothetical protein
MFSTIKAYKILVGKSEGLGPHWRPGVKRENNNNNNNNKLIFNKLDIKLCIMDLSQDKD